MPEKFISTRTELESYVGSAVCLFKDGVLESYCVLKTPYGADYSKIQNSFDIRSDCVYNNICNTTDAALAFNNWMSEFF